MPFAGVGTLAFIRTRTYPCSSCLSSGWTGEQMGVMIVFSSPGLVLQSTEEVWLVNVFLNYLCLFS